MRKLIIKAIVLFLAPFFLAMLMTFLEFSTVEISFIVISLSMTASYFSIRRLLLIIKLSKIGVEVTAYYRVLINSALGLGLIKVEFELNGKEEVCCIYNTRPNGGEIYKLLIDPNNFKHYLILGVEN